MEIGLGKKFSFSDQRGVGIVEAMIGVAIVAVTALAMFQMSIISNRLSTNTRGANDFNALVNEIRGMLQTEQSCRLSLGGPDAYGGPDIPNRTQEWVNNVGIYLYRPITNGAVFLADPTPAIPLGPPPPDKVRWKEWEILDLKLQLDPGSMGGPGSADLTPVRLFLNVRRRTEEKTFLRISAEIRFTIQRRPAVGPNQSIVSCQSMVFGTDSQRAPICGSDQALISRDGKLVCRKIQCIPPQTRFIGFDSEGNVQCELP